MNLSVIQNETSCAPSPCGRLSRPRTTIGAPPPDRLVGRDSAVSGQPIHATTLLSRASPVPLLALKRFRLDPNLCLPNSILLLPQTPANNWPLRRPGNLYSSLRCLPTPIASIRLGHSLFRADSRTASVLTGMGLPFSEGIGRANASKF